jgi:hypothetical protein
METGRSRANPERDESTTNFPMSPQFAAERFPPCSGRLKRYRDALAEVRRLDRDGAVPVAVLVAQTDQTDLRAIRHVQSQLRHIF